jgi:hypothetical protein
LQRSMRLVIMAAAASLSVIAGTVVVPNTNAAANGNAFTVIPFTGSPDSAWTFQFLLAASQFGSVPVGNQLTAIGFRLGAGQTTGPSSTFTDTSFLLELSSSPNGLGSLSTTFANNIGADAVTVYNSGLVVGANSLSGGAGPNPFFLINFSTPYTYGGGNLLVTLIHSAPASGVLLLDANSPGDGLGNTVGHSSFNATTGESGYNYPVTEFVFGPATTPEPATLGLVGTAILAAWIVCRRRVHVK